MSKLEVIRGHTISEHMLSNLQKYKTTLPVFMRLRSGQSVCDMLYNKPQVMLPPLPPPLPPPPPPPPIQDKTHMSLRQSLIMYKNIGLKASQAKRRADTTNDLDTKLTNYKIAELLYRKCAKLRINHAITFYNGIIDEGHSIMIEMLNNAAVNCETMATRTVMKLDYNHRLPFIFH